VSKDRERDWEADKNLLSEIGRRGLLSTPFTSAMVSQRHATVAASFPCFISALA
jgi:hypothetical protein